jgi:hypothetical protein
LRRYLHVSSRLRKIDGSAIRPSDRDCAGSLRAAQPLNNIISKTLPPSELLRFRRALGALFGGAVGKDTVNRVWRKVKSDADAWNALKDLAQKFASPCFPKS